MHTPTVAEFLSYHFEVCGLLQKEIAEKCQFPKPNVLSMLKKGQTKLPIDKVGPMAQALGVDPVQLFALCMREYHPETWAAIAPYFDLAMTPGERTLLRKMRALLQDTEELDAGTRALELLHLMRVERDGSLGPRSAAFASDAGGISIDSGPMGVSS